MSNIASRVSNSLRRMSRSFLQWIDGYEDDGYEDDDYDVRDTTTYSIEKLYGSGWLKYGDISVTLADAQGRVATLRATNGTDRFRIVRETRKRKILDI